MCVIIEGRSVAGKIPCPEVVPPVLLWLGGAQGDGEGGGDREAVEERAPRDGEEL